MNKTEFIEKWWVRDDLDPSDFKSDLSALIEREKRKAYPDTEAGGYVFCGKCGKMK